jgi:hypothetical protein
MITVLYAFLNVCAISHKSVGAEKHSPQKSVFYMVNDFLNFLIFRLVWCKNVLKFIKNAENVFDLNLPKTIVSLFKK